jgi:LytS/YehU family sensor histidine kinase
MNKILSFVYIFLGGAILIAGPFGILVLGIFGGATTWTFNIIAGIGFVALLGLLVMAIGVAILKEKKWGYVGALLLNTYLFLSVVVPSIQILLDDTKYASVALETLFKPYVIAPVVATPFLLIQLLKKRREKSEAKFLDS